MDFPLVADLGFQQVHQKCGRQQIASAARTQPPGNELAMQFGRAAKGVTLANAALLQKGSSLYLGKVQSGESAPVHQVRIVELAQDREKALYFGEIPAMRLSGAQRRQADLVNQRKSSGGLAARASQVMPPRGPQPVTLALAGVDGRDLLPPGALDDFAQRRVA